MAWIKCSYKLPEPFEYVLIYGNGINSYMKTSFLFRNEVGLEWQDREFIPTHWMALPQPPKD